MRQVDPALLFRQRLEYYNGKTETILGRALRDGRREKVFLMTKV